MMMDFFSRSITDFVPPATLDIARQAREMISRGHDVINLAIGQPDFAPPAHVKEAAIAAIRDNETGYTDMDGMAVLKAAVAEKFRRENNLNYMLEQISIGGGGTQIICNALRSTLNPGDEVIVTAPYWDAYPYIVKLAGGTPVFVRTRPEQGFKLQPRDLEKAITGRTKWVLLNSPNNPTGATFAEDELCALADVLKRHPQIWIISDEVYEKHIYARPNAVSIAAIDSGSLFERTVTVNSFSKSHNMSGYRIGYGGTASAELIRHMLAVQTLTSLSPNAVGQAAAIAALEGDKTFLTAQRETLEKRLRMAVGILNAVPGLSCAMPEGAFFLYVNCERLMMHSKTRTFSSDTAIGAFLLQEAKIAVAPGESFGLSPYFRISGTSKRLEEACRRIEKACQQL